jgi:alginate O-acetyltransferase complex protein AlgI
MLFNSPEFTLVFLPGVVISFYLVRRWIGVSGTIPLLIVASLAYYAWWSAYYAVLLIGWILINAAVAWAIVVSRGRIKKWLLYLGIAINLVVLGYFKYRLFFAESLGSLIGMEFVVGKVILPIGISFFTFQKIAFLVDAWRGEIKSFNLLHYLFFVTFFPQLIAGPIVHYRELAPQLAGLNQRTRRHDLAVGVSLFVVGLFKKTVLADTSASFSDPIFAAVAGGQMPDQATVWVGALAYSFQLYFDFSGYSDMALGCARMMGITLPLNFNSPYKASSIIDFWRRWHITLSRFIRDYLYLPLGGSRGGQLRMHLNLVVVMVLAGLWHGAAWNFVVWGALHAVMLSVNHLWRAVLGSTKFGAGPAYLHLCAGALARIVTFGCVVVAWIPFRADSLPAAFQMMAAAVGLGTHAPLQMPNATALAWLAAMLIFVNFLPNSCELFRKYESALLEPRVQFKAEYAKLVWAPTWRWAAFCGVLCVVCVLTYSRASPFIYFQF